MQKYLNRGGNSNVHSFETTTDSITVMFNDGAKYLYTVDSTGYSLIEEMKQLALMGQGLNSLISRVVRSKFARKWR
ncbi:TPA: hypothetical protein ACX6PV_003828 [Photobacterium damselae]